MLGKIEKVYQFLRSLEKNQSPLRSAELLAAPEVQSFLELKLETTTEKKLQEILFHIKDGMNPQQLEYLLVPFERHLQKNLKDDDFIVHSADAAYASTAQKFPLHVALENIRSSFNVGSFFRLADGLGVKSIHLCGYTPFPSKTAMGSAEVVNFQQHEKSENCMELLKSQGVKLIGIETTNKSLAYDAPYTFDPVCFFFGNERFGLNHNTLRMCDELRSIPMHGMKNSLNVAVCGGIVISEWVRQREQE